MVEQSHGYVNLKLGRRYSVDYFVNADGDGREYNHEKCKEAAWCDAPRHRKICPKYSEITYSDNSKKRFREVCDKFSLIFESAYEYGEDILYYRHKGKVHKRKPVFLTLTIPRQKATDIEIKRQALTRFIEDLKRYKNLKNYIWKAEAQERGEIHFHMVLDSFIFEREARKMWFRKLQICGCLPYNLKINKASRLVHFKLIEDIEAIGDMVGAYFEGTRDENGRLIHKHDNEKRVRDISGRTWGCSESLKFGGITLEGVNSVFLDKFSKGCLNVKPMANENGEIMANVYAHRYADFNPGTNKVEVKKQKNPLHELLTAYHFSQAELIYGPSARKDKRPESTLKKFEQWLKIEK